MDFELDKIVSKLDKPAKARPYGEIENFSAWAKKCIGKYAEKGNLHQTFQVSHASMIFESLWATGTVPSEGLLLDWGKSALYALEKLNTAQTPNELSELDEEILAIILYIREYFIINDCFDPYSCMTVLGKIWVEPEHPPRHYLSQLKVFTQVLT